MAGPALTSERERESEGERERERERERARERERGKRERERDSVTEHDSCEGQQRAVAVAICAACEGDPGSRSVFRE
jgi:hypothetical protein